MGAYAAKSGLPVPEKAKLALLFAEVCGTLESTLVHVTAQVCWRQPEMDLHFVEHSIITDAYDASLSVLRKVR